MRRLHLRRRDSHLPSGLTRDGLPQIESLRRWHRRLGMDNSLRKRGNKNNGDDSSPANSSHVVPHSLND